MADKTSMGAVLQFARDIDKKHDGGHGRLRGDLDRAETRILALELQQKALELNLERSTTAPVDIGKIVGNWKVVGILAFTIAVNLTGNWFSSAPIREAQGKIQESVIRIQEQFSDNVRLQDERFKAVNDKLDDSKRQMEMRRLEIQQLNNDIQQLRRGK